MSADITELIAFRNKLEDIQGQKNVVVSAIAKEVTARLLRKVKKRTPVKTGILRRGWTTGNTYNGGSYIVVMVNNNTYYASYVENGHRKRNKKGWVHYPAPARSASVFDFVLAFKFFWCFRMFVAIV